jgi:YbbR domain-containing protein
MNRFPFLRSLDLLENWRIKLAAVIIAVLFWFAVVSEGEYEYEVDLPLVPIDIPHGKTLIEPLPETARVRLEGKGKAMLALLFYRDARVLVDCGGIHRSRYLALTPQMVEPPRRRGAIVAREILSPDSVWVRLSPLSRKRVPVVSGFTLHTVPGYVLASPVKLEPDSVTVEGAEEEIRKVDSVFTEEHAFQGLRSSILRRLKIAPPPGTSIKLSAQVVECFADVQKLLEVTLDEIPVEVRNAPASLQVSVVPSTVALKLEGGEKILLGLGRKDVHVYIDYDRAIREPAAPGHAAYISVPEGVRYSDVTPERFTLSVAKKSNHETSRN